jgi:hypothetical protein
LVAATVALVPTLVAAAVALVPTWVAALIAAAVALVTALIAGTFIFALFRIIHKLLLCSVSCR